jgi:hypothetical protein
MVLSMPKNGRQVAIVHEIAAADALRHTTPTAEEINMATMLQSLGLAIYQATVLSLLERSFWRADLGHLSTV